MSSIPFTKPLSEPKALDAQGSYVAGGTTLVDLMRLGVATPDALVDVTGGALESGIASQSGGLMVGAGVTMSTLADCPNLKAHHTVVREALLLSASVQIRNRATIGGNLLQATRCGYFRDIDACCNRRIPNTGCDAIGGITRSHAVLGCSDACIAVSPGDLPVALLALDAVIHVIGPNGRRDISVGDFYLQPDDTPHIQFSLAEGDLITQVFLPGLAGSGSAYIKLRDRKSYAFALASAAAVVVMKDGMVAKIGLALGGVGTVPWRADIAESMLRGQALSLDLVAQAAEAVFAGAKVTSENKHKVSLGVDVLKQAIHLAAARSEGGE